MMNGEAAIIASSNMSPICLHIDRNLLMFCLFLTTAAFEILKQEWKIYEPGSIINVKLKLTKIGKTVIKIVQK